MAKKKVAKKKTTRNPKKDDKKLFAFLATFFTIIGFIIAFVIRRDDKYVMFYAKQGLVLFIAQVVISIVDLIPLFGAFFGVILWILWIVIWVMTWLNALSGEMKDTWLIGEFARKITI